MAESLWNTIDDYLAAQVLADMGPAGDYTTLVLASVEKWAQFDVVDFAGMQLPFAILLSSSATSIPAGHDGSTVLKRTNTHLVAVACVTEGTKAEATRNAKTFVWRMEKLFASVRFQDVTADDGSKASQVIKGDGMFRSEINLWSKPTSKADSVYGLGITAFAVRGTTA